jgi:hypothetical protein
VRSVAALGGGADSAPHRHQQGEEEGGQSQPHAHALLPRHPIVLCPGLIFWNQLDLKVPQPSSFYFFLI